MNRSMIASTQAYGLDFNYPARDQIVGRCLADHSEFARIEQDLIVQLLATAGRPGLFLDVGANIGSIALPVASRRPDCLVIAIEANRRLATLLAANAVRNQLENVEVINAAAGAAEGLLAFPAPEMSAPLNFGDMHTRLIEMNPTMPRENVRVCTLDEIAQPGVARVVKLDVQGAEGEVIAGARRLLLEERPAWIFETAQSLSSEAVIQTFLDADYDLYWLFSPFVTAKAKNYTRATALSGDTSAVALPRGTTPPISMPRVNAANDRRPGDTRAYPYLSDYGF